MSNINLIHKLCADVVGGLRTAEPFDRYRDQRAQRGTWPRNKQPGRVPRPPAPVMRERLIKSDAFNIPGYLGRSPRYKSSDWTPQGVLVKSYLKEDGYIQVVCIFVKENDGGLEWEPSLSVFNAKAARLASSVKHFEFGKFDSRQNQIVGWYRLADTPKNPKRPPAWVVSSENEPLTEFAKRIKTGLRA